MSALTTQQVSQGLEALGDWSRHSLEIYRHFQFADFEQAIDFVNQIARLAQRLNHHPDIDIRYNQVTLRLSTHDEGGITEKDLDAARECDKVYAQHMK